MCDRPAHIGGFSAKEIEITPEMIKAGESAILKMAGDIIPAVGGEAQLHVPGTGPGRQADRHRVAG